jgi:hypothetical protein
MLIAYLLRERLLIEADLFTREANRYAPAPDCMLRLRHIASRMADAIDRLAIVGAWSTDPAAPVLIVRSIRPT